MTLEDVAATTDISISIERKKLSDGSRVFNVHLGTIILHAFTEQDAWDMAFAIESAINRHSNEVAKVLEAE